MTPRLITFNGRMAYRFAWCFEIISINRKMSGISAFITSSLIAPTALASASPGRGR